MGCIQETKGWKDTGKGTLRLYKDHQTGKKRWLAIRNITGKVSSFFGLSSVAARGLVGQSTGDGELVRPLAVSLGTDVRR